MVNYLKLDSSKQKSTSLLVQDPNNMEGENLA